MPGVLVYQSLLAGCILVVEVLIGLAEATKLKKTKLCHIYDQIGNYLAKEIKVAYMEA